MTSTKNKNKIPQLTRRVALTTLPGAIFAMRVLARKVRLCRQFQEGW